MNLAFDLGNVESTEFGLYITGDNGPTGVVVPADGEVKGALLDMAIATWREMRNEGGDGSPYEPSEKHATKEYLYVPISHDEVRALGDLHEANNLPLHGGLMRDADAFSCYFARFVDGKGRSLTGMRRAAYFKGILKNRNRLLRLVSNSLTIVGDDVFKLDNDFDLLVDSAHVHILRPTAFEIIADMKEAVLGAVANNVTTLRGQLAFVDLTVVQEYASSHPRAARYLASVCSGRHGEGVDRIRLVELCRRTGVRIEDTNGVVSVAEANVMGFLEVLDRRRYGVDLVRDVLETYKAASRQKI